MPPCCTAHKRLQTNHQSTLEENKHQQTDETMKKKRKYMDEELRSGWNNNLDYAYFTTKDSYKGSLQFIVG